MARPTPKLPPFPPPRVKNNTLHDPSGSTGYNTFSIDNVVVAVNKYSSASLVQAASFTTALPFRLQPSLSEKNTTVTHSSPQPPESFVATVVAAVLRRDPHHLCSLINLNLQHTQPIPRRFRRQHGSLQDRSTTSPAFPDGPTYAPLLQSMPYLDVSCALPPRSFKSYFYILCRTQI